MKKRKAKRVYRKLSEDQRRKYLKAIEDVEQERDEIDAEGKQLKEEFLAIKNAVNALKSERESQGLSLADIRERTNIQRSALCALENDKYANPTIKTLMRYADAVGKVIMIQLQDKQTLQSSADSKSQRI